MLKTIFVAIIGIVLVALSIWMWWFDNCGSTKKDDKEEENK